MKIILISILIMIHISLKAEEKKPNLSTDIKFNGQTINGKRQAPFESLTEVENDKIIDQLIGVRKNFNDRIIKLNQLR